jgi:hypothetical protein
VTVPLPVSDDERAALQALLRGAYEAAALLPEWSTRRDVVKDLADDLAELLARDVHPGRED